MNILDKKNVYKDVLPKEKIKDFGQCICSCSGQCKCCDQSTKCSDVLEYIYTEKRT